MTREEIYNVVRDCMTGAELVELLQISVNDILHEFGDDLIDKWPEVSEILNIEQEDEKHSYYGDEQ